MLGQGSFNIFHDDAGRRREQHIDKITLGGVIYTSGDRDDKKGPTEGQVKGREWSEIQFGKMQDNASWEKQSDTHTINGRETPGKQ